MRSRTASSSASGSSPTSGRHVEALPVRGGRVRPSLSVGLLALAVPPAASARGVFDPTTEFEQHEWVPIHLGPLNLSVTKAVVYLMIGTVLTILLGIPVM